MELKRVFTTSMLALSLACSPYIKETSLEIVEAGEIGYNEGKIESKGFVGCSAVVFDYGNSASFAHAYPYLEEGGEGYIHAGNVVDSLIRYSKTRGISTKPDKVFVNAGDKESLEAIIRSLESNGISPTEVSKRFEKLSSRLGLENSSKISYDPFIDDLSVEKSNFSKRLDKLIF